MKVTAPRALALKVLRRARQTEGWVREILESALSGDVVDARDRALVTRLVYGVAEMQGTLDFVIDRYVDRPGRLDPAARDALRLAVYELLFSDAEAHAVVHQGVELVRSVAVHASGLANAVLRRIAADASAFPWGDPETDLGALALATGHPLWLAERFAEEFGFTSAAEIMRADHELAPLYLALNPFRTSAEDAFARLGTDGADPVACDLPGCIEAREPAAAVRGTALAEGLVVVADASAQLVATLAPLAPAATVLEIAAGRGTKTLLLQAAAIRAGDPAEITAVDVHPFKAKVLGERMDFLGVPGVVPLIADATDPDALGAALPGGADLVFIDAPCSGLGTLRRHPEKRWRLGPDDIDELAGLGQRILGASSRLVRPGGFVVYSTCTIVRRENGDVIEEFLDSDEGRGFEVYDITERLPVSLRPAVAPRGWIQTLPTIGGPDGHFAAVLMRT